MKNRIRFLSLMLLVILFAVPCSVACAEQKTMMESKSEDDLMVFGLCTVKDTSYILYGSYDPSQPMRILSWTESQTEPELWAEGLIGCKSVSSLEQMAAESKPAEIIVEHAVCRLFTDGERLMSFNPWNGKVFVLSSVEGKATFQDIVTIKDTSFFLDRSEDYSYPYNCTGCAVSGENLICTVTYWDNETDSNVQNTIIVDLTTGDVKASKAAIYAVFSGNGKDGETVLLLRDDENAYDSETEQWQSYIFVSFDPVSDAVTTLGEIEAQTLLGAPVWSEALKSYVYADQNSHIYAVGQNGATKQVGFYSGGTQISETGIVLNGNSVLIPGDQCLLACSLSSDFNADQKLTTYQFNSLAAQKSFHAKYPNVPVYQSGQYYHDYQMLLLAMNNGELDVLSFSSGSSPYEALRDKGYFADLSGNAEIVSIMENVWTPFKNFCMKDGRIVAVPYGCSISTNLWGAPQDILDELGMTVDDLPKDFISLCAFVTKWNDEMTDDYPNIVPMYYEGMAVSRDTLIRMAVEFYVRYMDAVGETLTFDTPLFREMAEAIEKTRTENLQAMLEKNSGEDLYEIEALMEYGMAFQELWSNDSYAYFEMKPTPACESVACANLHLLTVNASSVHQALAAQLVLDALKTVRAENRFLLFSDASEPVEDPYTKKGIEQIEEKIALLKESMAASPSPENEELLSGWESEIQEMQQYLWLVSADEIRMFQEEIAPIMHVQTPDILHDSEGNSSEEMWTLIRRWQDGQIDVEQFIRLADKKMDMIRMEKN